MNLINSYLSETSKHLPDESREDILDELRVSLEEQVFERAESNNREVRVEDEKAVLLEFGHPVRLAASYKRTQYLIGPELYPAYIQSLKIGLSISLAIQFVVALVSFMSTGWDMSFAFVVNRVISAIFWLVLVVTLVFVGLEYSGEKLHWYSEWHPDSLPREPTSSVDSGDMITNIISEGALLLWWNNILMFVSEQDLEQVSLSPVWDPLFWPINIILGISLLMHAYLMLSGGWTRVLLNLEILVGISSVALCAYLMLNRPLTSIQNTVNSNDWFWVENLTMSVLVFIVLVWLWDLFKYFKILSRM